MALVSRIVLVLLISLSLASTSDWEASFHASCNSTHHATTINDSLISGCKTCVTLSVKQQGDPTRCHTCLQSPMASDEVKASCLACVPAADRLKLGWACAQYCSHHHIIDSAEESVQCHGCLFNQEVKDKWGCHVCMEQAGHDLKARQGCFGCLTTSTGAEMYLCAACGRVLDPSGRKECFSCLMGSKRSSCLSRHNVSLEFHKPPSKAAEIIKQLQDHEHQQDQLQSTERNKNQV
jgi:hypothetical protein